MKPQSNTTKGIFFIICSAFFFALMAVFVRLAGDIHFVQKAFFRNAVAFLIALGGTIRDARLNGRDAIRIPKGAPLYLFLRAFAGSVGEQAVSIACEGSGTATVDSFTCPRFGVLMLVR